MKAIRGFHKSMLACVPLAEILTVRIGSRNSDQGQSYNQTADHDYRLSAPDTFSGPGASEALGQNPRTSQVGELSDNLVPNIHRGFVPYLDLMVDFHAGTKDPRESTWMGVIGVPIPPYIWYEVRSTEYQNCLSGRQTIEAYNIDLEIVSFDMEQADTIECLFDTYLTQLRNSIMASHGLCFIEPTPTPCDWGFQDIEIVSTEETYKTFNQIAIDLGATVKDKHLRIYL